MTERVWTRDQLGELVGVERIACNRSVYFARAEQDGWLPPSVRRARRGWPVVAAALYSDEDAVVALAVTATYPFAREERGAHLDRIRSTLAAMVREHYDREWLCFSEDDAIGTDDARETVVFVNEHPGEVVCGSFRSVDTGGGSVRDPDVGVVADAECAAIGHIRCEEVTFDQEVTRTWCPRCGCDLTNDEEGPWPTD